MLGKPGDPHGATFDTLEPSPARCLTTADRTRGSPLPDIAETFRADAIRLENRVGRLAGAVRATARVGVIFAFVASRRIHAGVR